MSKFLVWIADNPYMKPSVFVIDNQLNQSQLLKLTLEEGGFFVRYFYRAEDSMNDLSQGYWPDIILVDQDLSGILGIDFVQRIRAMEIDCPVVILAESPSEDLALAAMNLNVYAILPKPFHGKGAIPHLQRVISHHRSLKLNDELVGEFEIFADCAEQLIAMYERQLNQLTPSTDHHHNSLSQLILRKEASKWLKKAGRARKIIKRVRSEQQQIKSCLKPPDPSEPDGGSGKD